MEDPINRPPPAEDTDSSNARIHEEMTEEEAMESDGTDTAMAEPEMPVPDEVTDVQPKEIAWRHDQHTMFGKTITTKRKVAWYADQPFSYTYSNTTKKARPWIPVLAELKNLIEKESGEPFNSCLLNLYHNGSEGMAWHSDAERELKRHGAIASFSLGAARKFSFKHT